MLSVSLKYTLFGLKSNIFDSKLKKIHDSYTDNKKVDFCRKYNLVFFSNERDLTLFTTCETK